MGSTEPSPSVDAELHPVEAPEFVAVVKLRGEHDIATTPQLVEVLAPLKGNLLVDLSACDFEDSSFAAIAARAAETLQRDGYRVEVLVPPGRSIWRACSK